MPKAMQRDDERELEQQKEAPRLHGVKHATPESDGEFYFAVLNLFKPIEHAQAFPGRNKYPGLEAWPRQKADSFLLGLGKLEDTFWKVERVAELLDQSRRKWVLNFDSGTITEEQIAAFQQAGKDFPLYLDALLLYLRILADCLANLTSAFPFYKDNQVPRDSFREHRNWFLGKRRHIDPDYAEILENQTNWFTTLSGKKHGEGLRDLIVHKMVRIQLFYRPGETPDKNQIDAFLYGGPGVKGANLVPAIQKLVAELFLFLDSYVAHFAPRIEQSIGAVLKEYHEPSFARLFVFKGELPSEWLYPKITPEPLKL